MTEQFLTLMADLDEESQAIMGEWYEQLKKSGFVGKQTPGLPFHISLATFSIDKEQDVIEESATICRALPILLESFHPFVGKITRLHLCAFWPTREIMSVDLCEL